MAPLPPPQLLVNYTDWLRAFQRACHGGTVNKNKSANVLFCFCYVAGCLPPCAFTGVMFHLQIPSDSVEKALAVLNANKCSRLCGEGEKLSSLGRPLTVITSGSLR